MHRKHHTFTDQDGDPHSPRLLGFWRLQVLNAFYYAREAGNPETLRKFAPDIQDVWLDRAVFSRGWTGLLVGITLLCALLGVWAGLIAAGVHAVLYVLVLAPLIDALGHWRGTKTFENTAHNWPSLSWMTAGESLHNIHHRDRRRDRPAPLSPGQRRDQERIGRGYASQRTTRATPDVRPKSSADTFQRRGDDRQPCPSFPSLTPMAR